VPEIEQTILVGARLRDVKVRPDERNEKGIKEVVQQLDEEFRSLGKIAGADFGVRVVLRISTAHPLDTRDLRKRCQCYNCS